MITYNKHCLASILNSIVSSVLSHWVLPHYAVVSAPFEKLRSRKGIHKQISTKASFDAVRREKRRHAFMLLNEYHTDLNAPRMNNNHGAMMRRCQCAGRSHCCTPLKYAHLTYRRQRVTHPSHGHASRTVRMCPHVGGVHPTVSMPEALEIRETLLQTYRQPSVSTNTQPGKAKR